MSTHQFDPNSPSDELYVGGDLKYLVVGNECRLLDRRRTPGVIVAIDMDGGFFRWEISAFEDQGKYWDVTFERVVAYQFKRSPAEASLAEVQKYKIRIQQLDQIVEISDSQQARETSIFAIQRRTLNVLGWLDANSKFFASAQKIDFQALAGPDLLRADFNRYMAASGLSEIENRTAELQVMNPHSGDWIKAMHVVMAEMGLKSYRGSPVRSPQAFTGIGSRERRRDYIEHRLAFLRGVFSRIGLREVELYRGMSTEWDWQAGAQSQYRFWSSWTFNHQVARDFTDLAPGGKQKNSYLVKRAIPVENLFMTYLETDAMNRQYLEAEAIVLHTESDRLLW